jgi:hypothetical protein
MDGHRQDADGRLLHWRVTGNAQVGGLIPFLISWGETRHPAADAPGGLTLRSLAIVHPRPAEIETALAALGADVEVHQAPQAALVAQVDGPTGVAELR